MWEDQSTFFKSNISPLNGTSTHHPGKKKSWINKISAHHADHLFKQYGCDAPEAVNMAFYMKVLRHLRDVIQLKSQGTEKHWLCTQRAKLLLSAAVFDEEINSNHHILQVSLL